MRDLFSDRKLASLSPFHFLFVLHLFILLLITRVVLCGAHTSVSSHGVQLHPDLDVDLRYKFSRGIVVFYYYRASY